MSDFIIDHQEETYRFPDWLERRFRSVIPDSREKIFYGPYDSLLNEHFKGKDGFMVCPVMYPIDSGHSIDFTVYFEVYIGTTPYPVFILETKRQSNLTETNNDERIKADSQMRERYRQMLNACPIPRLYGISAFGTKIAFYSGDTFTKRITPSRIMPTDPDLVEDLAPAIRWNNNDILDLKCAYKLWQIFNEIHEECSKLKNL